MVSKKDLAIVLSLLERFSAPKINLEQYATDGEIAATILWDAFMQGNIKNKVVADLGCGTGVLGIGCLLLGAKKVYFVDCDEISIALLHKNLKMAYDSYEIPGTYEIEYRNVDGFFQEVDIVVQNPPFGTQEKHADKMFLEKAFSIAKVVYSFHKTATKSFVSAIALDYGFRIKQTADFSFPLKKTMQQHTKKVEMIEVSCFWMERV